jgi:hypothetical protein
MQKFTLLILLFFGLLSACTFQNEEEYFEHYNCNTDSISYDSVTVVFKNICLQCHSTSFTRRDGIFFDNYELTKASINTGLVLPAIKHAGPYKMPYNMDKLSDCQIERIEAWIEDGMPEKYTE